MAQKFTFDKTDNGWFIRLSDMHDIDTWDREFYVKIFEKAASNLLIGKEYGNSGLYHGPYASQAALSDAAYMFAQSHPVKDLRTTSTAMAYLYEMRAKTLFTLKRHIHNNQIIYANKAGGYHLKDKNTIVLDTIESESFPEN